MSGTIVCIDDEQALCRIFVMILRKTGAPVEGFTDPHEALAFMRDHPIAFVLCDHRMPTLSGLDVLARMPRPAPFVMVSGDLDVEQFRDTTPGLTAVLTKPFSPDRLLALVQQHLGVVVVQDPG